MAKLKGRYTKKSDIPEDQVGLYTEFTDDAGETFWIPDVEEADGWAVENVAALRAVVQEERGTRRRLEKQAKALEGLGDIDEVRERLAKLEELEANPPDPKGGKDVEKVTKQWAEKERALLERHKAEIENLQAERTKYEGLYHNTKLEHAVSAAIAKANGIPELLTPHVMQRVKANRREDGEIDLLVVDKSGNEAITQKAGQVGNMSLEELVESMAKDKVLGRCFHAEGLSGSGATSPTSAPGMGKGTVKLTQEQALDPAQWEAAQAKAAESGGQVVIAD